MTGDVTARCLQCGLEIQREGNDWICGGCNIRVDRHGRRLRKQPTKAKKALRRLREPTLFDGPEPGAPPGALRRIPNYEEPPTPLRLRPKRPSGKLWCKPCDRLFVVRHGRKVCLACGVIYEPAA